MVGNIFHVLGMLSVDHVYKSYFHWFHFPKQFLQSSLVGSNTCNSVVVVVVVVVGRFFTTGLWCRSVCAPSDMA